MHRSWLVLLVVGALLVAGCSAPGSPATSPDDIDYPAGWSEAGLTNTSAAVDTADASLADTDFVERRAFVEPLGPNATEDALIRVLVVRVDREQSRLLTEEHFYRVSDEDVTRVTEEGVSVLSEYEPVESRLTYLNESGAYRYLNLSGRDPVVRSLDGGSYGAAIDQPLPAVFAATVDRFAAASYANPTATDAGVRYEIANVSMQPMGNASGHLTVGPDGLVAEYVISESLEPGEVTLAYELDVGDVSVDQPTWLA